MKSLILILLFFISSCANNDCIDDVCPYNHQACPTCESN